MAKSERINAITAKTNGFLLAPPAKAKSIFKLTIGQDSNAKNAVGKNGAYFPHT